MGGGCEDSFLKEALHPAYRGMGDVSIERGYKVYVD